MNAFKEEFFDIIKKTGVKKTIELSGISESTLEKWLYCDGNPTIDLVVKVLDSLGQEILIFDKDERFDGKYIHKD